MQEIRYARSLFSSLATMLAAADAVLERTGVAAEEERHIREFTEAIGGRKNFNENTVQLYETEGKNYRAALNILRRADIPCVAYTAKKSEDTLIAVPQAFREKADKIINSLNRTAIKNEQTRAEFMRTHVGNECTKFRGIDKSVQRLIRDSMAKETIEYAFETNKPGEFSLYCDARDAAAVEKIIYEARAAVRGSYARETEFVAAKQDLAIKDADLSMQSGGDRIIYLFDAEKTTGGALYAIENGILSKVDKTGAKKLVADSIVDPAKFKAHITAVIRDMTIPLVAAKTRAEVKDIGKDQEPGRIFSGGRIENARKEYEKSQPDNPRVAVAEKCASRLAYAIAVGGKTQEEALTELSRLTAIPEITARAEGMPDLENAVERLKTVELTEAEQREVIEYVRESCKEQIDAQGMDIEITADMLAFKDMRKWIGYENEMVLDTSDKELHPDLTDRGDNTRIEVDE